MTLLIALGILLSSTTAASGAEKAESASTSTEAGTAQAKKAKKPKKICKADPRVTGTRIAKRICKTKEEWEAGADTQQADVRTQGGAGGN